MARNLRHKQTEAEKRLWAGLRSRQLEGAKSRRIGPYVVDFVCFERKLVIEVDGVSMPRLGRVRKIESGKYGWKGRGFVLCAFWDNDVLGNLAGVLESVREGLR